MKNVFNRGYTHQVLSFLFALIPVLFALWIYIQTSVKTQEPEMKTTVSDSKKQSVADSGSDEFIAADEFDEFEPYSDNDKANQNTKTAGQDKKCSLDCDSCSIGESEKTTVTRIQNDKTLNELKSSASEEPEILGFDNRQALIMLISFAGVILSGLAVRSSRTRKIRIFFIMSGIAFFGFYVGGCPCPIIGIFKFAQLARGETAALPLAIWTGGILYLTYFLGKSWCGWICPIGGLQEIVYRPGILKKEHNETLLKILRISRIIIVTFLMTWVAVTGVILLSKFDPFKPIFNLFYGGISVAALIALIVIVLSAPIVNRPFCKTVCPLGLVMGLISRLPGAARIQIADTCKTCKKCQKSCQTGAIILKDDLKRISYEDCVFCGDCLEDCGHINIKGKKKC